MAAKANPDAKSKGGSIAVNVKQPAPQLDAAPAPPAAAGAGASAANVAVRGRIHTVVATIPFHPYYDHTNPCHQQDGFSQRFQFKLKQWATQDKNSVDAHTAFLFGKIRPHVQQSFGRKISHVVVVPSSTPSASKDGPLYKLASQIAGQLKAKYNPDGLVRTSQITKLAQGGSRDKSVHIGSITVASGLAGDVLLVDDVVSSGGSMNGCAELLLDAGVTNVYRYCITYTCTNTDPAHLKNKDNCVNTNLIEPEAAPAVAADNSWVIRWLQGDRKVLGSLARAAGAYAALIQLALIRAPAIVLDALVAADLKFYHRGVEISSEDALLKIAAQEEIGVAITNWDQRPKVAPAAAAAAAAPPAVAASKK